MRNIVPIIIIFCLAIVIPVFAMLLAFNASSLSGWGWFAVTAVSIVSIGGSLVIYGIARLAKRQD